MHKLTKSTFSGTLNDAVHFDLFNILHSSSNRKKWSMQATPHNGKSTNFPSTCQIRLKKGKHVTLEQQVARGPWHWCRCGRPNKKRWINIKMMFQGDDRKALQTLVDNNTITPEAWPKFQTSLRSSIIQTTRKEYDHFWYYWDQLVWCPPEA